jgi:periplasmic protein CpxP/Spy
MKLNNSIHRQRRSMALAVATVALAAAAALALPAFAQGHGPGDAGAQDMKELFTDRAMGGGFMGGHGGHRGMGGGHFSERLLDEAKATPEQKAQIRAIMESARKDLAAQRTAQQGLRQEALRVFTQPNVDANAVEALRQKRMAQHDQSSRRMSQAMLEASRVLTPEQRTQLAQRMQRRQQMMERHRHERQSLDGPKS